MKQYKKLGLAIVLSLALLLIVNTVPGIPQKIAYAYGTNDGKGFAITNVTENGYKVGGVLDNGTNNSPYSIQFKTWTLKNGQGDLKIYENDNYNSWQTSGVDWYSTWQTTISIADHNNEYGTYETDIYKIYRDGSTVLADQLTVDVIPLTLTVAYQICNSSNIAINISANDNSSSPIVSEKWAVGYQGTDYFSNSGNAFSGNSFMVSSPGLYTVYIKDSLGYETSKRITVSSSYNEKPIIGINQSSTDPTSTTSINAIITSSTNLYNGDIGSSSYGNGCKDVTGSIQVPDSSTKTLLWTKDGQHNEFNGIQSNEGGLFNANPGDKYLISGWYKTSNTANSWLSAGDFDTITWVQYLQSTIDSAGVSLNQDNNWHYFYTYEQLNEEIDNSIVIALPCWDYSKTAGSVYINGIHWTKIPAGQDISTGISIKKWAYGNQPTSYFGDSGNTFSGNNFPVTQNGVITVYAKSVSGAEAVQTYTVSNIDSSRTDTTPPTISLSESGWSKSSVIVSANISDDQSGVSDREYQPGSYSSPGQFKATGKAQPLTDASFTTSTNGIYTVYARDCAGNEFVNTITVDHVDTQAPTCSKTLTYNTPSLGDITIAVTATDDGSGVDNIETPDGIAHAGSSFNYVVHSSGIYNFKATDKVGNATSYSINVSNTVSVTHPISVAYVINPNDSNLFTASNIPITNNSSATVKVTVQQMKSVPGKSLDLKDVPADKYSNWNLLTKAQTLSDIALGLKVSETSTGSGTWSQINTGSPVYIVNIKNTAFGVLNPGGTGNLSLTAKCGRAWDNNYSAQHSIVFIFSLI